MISLDFKNRKLWRTVGGCARVQQRVLVAGTGRVAVDVVGGRLGRACSDESDKRERRNCGWLLGFRPEKLRE